MDKEIISLSKRKEQIIFSLKKKILTANAICIKKILIFLKKEMQMLFFNKCVLHIHITEIQF